jgi:hypothetical protein
MPTREPQNDLPPTRSEQRRFREHTAYLAREEARERRLQVWGIVLLGLGIAAFSVWRAGWASVFPHGWWRL